MIFAREPASQRGEPALLVGGRWPPFSLHETTVAAGTELHLNYQNHSESVYCVAGKATVEDISKNRILPIEPGTFYSAGIGDEHILRIEKDTMFLCIFEPALKGIEEAD